jgi:hypothetical protein
VLSDENPIPNQLELMLEKAKLVASGALTCTAVFGPPGIGKTYLTEKLLKSMGTKYRATRGSGVGLMQSAYDLRNGGVLLMDDCDELITGGGISHTNRMKEFLSPHAVRKIHNMTKEAIKNEEGGGDKPGVLPTSFDVRCGVIWITNLDISTLDRKTAERVKPLIDRGLSPVRISSDPRHLLEYVEHLVMTGAVKLTGKSPGDMLTVEEKNDVLRYFHENAWRLETISVRTIEHLAKYRRVAPAKWRSIADSELRVEPILLNELGEAPQISIARRAA